MNNQYFLNATSFLRAADSDVGRDFQVVAREYERNIQPVIQGLVGRHQSEAGDYYIAAQEFFLRIGDKLKYRLRLLAEDSEELFNLVQARNAYISDVASWNDPVAYVPFLVAGGKACAVSAVFRPSGLTGTFATAALQPSGKIRMVQGIDLSGSDEIRSAVQSWAMQSMCAPRR